MGRKTCDFSGWATRNDLLCTDGRVIRRNAFKDNDHKDVPLVWNHQHNSPEMVMGHATLENRDEGVYAYCTFNDTERANICKTLVQHGDVKHLSIYANKLRQEAGNVLHGDILEVSLVHAGANPGALIDAVIQHGDMNEMDGLISEGTIDYVFDGSWLEHADYEEDESNNDGFNPDEIMDTLTDEQRQLMAAMCVIASGEELPIKPNSGSSENGGKTIKQVYDTLDEKQKKLLAALVGLSSEENVEHSEMDDYEYDLDESVEEGEENMSRRNVFDQEERERDEHVLSHSEIEDILADGQQYGSLKTSALQHGITNIEYLFPEARELNPGAPQFINNDDSWVAKVLNGVHKSPFSRVKTTFADITADEARARGYIKGDKKEDEVFSLLKRVTEPQTVYKHQSFDRDDLIDITDLDVVAFVKNEMRIKLKEEIARAILIGDGRRSVDRAKIKEDKIRPVWTDDDLYAIHYPVSATKEDTDAAKAEAFIDSVIMGMEHYEGRGNIDLFISKKMLISCLMLKDKVGRRLYSGKGELANAMGVNDIVPVMQFTDQSRTNSDGATCDLMGIALDLNDYNLGANKGGETSLFEDFDIDYNKEKFLLETRLSGALTKPRSAVVLEIVTPGA